MPSVPPRMFRFSQGHFYCTSFSKQNVLLKSHLHAISILSNIKSYVELLGVPHPLYITIKKPPLIGVEVF